MYFPPQYFLRIWSTIIFLVTVALYVWSMPASITLEDAGLFQMVCHQGGIGHPPGYPLFILSCQAFVGLPFFETSVFAGNLLSALFAGLTCALLVPVCFEILGDRVFAVFVAMVYGLSATFWSQAIIIEVYSLAALLIVGCLWLCLLYVRTSDVRFLYGLALVYGLALSNHWPLQGLASPALIAVLAIRWRSLVDCLYSPKQILILVTCLLVGLLPYLSLLQTAPPFAIYGAIESGEQFFKYVSRAAYEDHFEVAGWDDKAQYQLWVLQQTLREFSFLAAPLMLGGLFLSFRELKLSVSISLLLLYLGATSLLVLLLGFEFSDFRVAIFKPYPIVAYLAPAVWVGLGCRWLFRWVDRSAQRVAGLVPVSILLAAGIYNLPENYRGEDDFAALYAHKVLEWAPANAVLFVMGDNGVGLLGYLHHVAGVRPDIELRSWNSLVYGNRLSSAFAPQKELDKTRSDYIRLSERPVVSTIRPGYPVINRGLIFERSAEAGFDCVEGLHDYISYLLNVDTEAELMLDAHERELLFGLLLEMTRQHLGLVMFGDQPREEEIRVLQALQESFAGKIATLESLLQYPQDASGKALLRQLADTAATDLPAGTSGQISGLLEEYRGRITLLESADYKAAADHFQTSLDRNPSQGNASGCLLLQTLEVLQREDEAQVLRSTINSCD